MKPPTGSRIGLKNPLGPLESSRHESFPRRVLGPPRPRQRPLSQRPRAAPPSAVVARVMSSLSPAWLSPEGSHLLSCPRVCVARHRTCVHSRCSVVSVTHTSLRSGAGPRLSVCVCPSRSSRCLCVVMFWPCLAVAGDAPSGQSHLCHPFVCGSPASPLLSRKPILAPQQRRRWAWL